MDLGSKKERRLVVGITGESGSVYAVRFLEAVLPYYDRIYLTISENASGTIQRELGIDFPTDPIDTHSLLGKYCERVEVCRPGDLTAPPSSGSVQHDGMVVVPCSMGTVGRIASGVSSDLLTRAADVCLQERRPLILVIRETPLGLIHLRNLTALAEAGAVILPACPGFSQHPKTVDDMVSFIVARIMQQLGLSQSLLPEWRLPE